MPLQSFPKIELVVEIPDVIIGKTSFKRKAFFRGLVYEPDVQKVIIKIEEVSYANEDDKYGELLNFDSKFVELISNNKNLVDITNGIKLANEEFIIDENGEKILNPLLEGKLYGKQFDFWNYVASSQPVILHSAIRTAIEANYQ